MTLDESIKVLELFNKWRRGEEIPQENPTKIGIAIDIVLDELKKLSHFTHNTVECDKNRIGPTDLIDLEKNDLVKLLTVTLPYYSKLSESEKDLVAKGGLLPNGSTTGELYWNYCKLVSMDRLDLFKLYVICKDSWKR